MYGLIFQSPIVALVGADAGFMSYKSGIYQCSRVTVTSMINHAVSVIGYDQDGNYIIKNSWGKFWGYNGFGYVSKNMDCGLKLYVYQINNTAPDEQLVLNNKTSDNLNNNTTNNTTYNTTNNTTNNNTNNTNNNSTNNNNTTNNNSTTNNNTNNNNNSVPIHNNTNNNYTNPNWGPRLSYL